MTTPTPAAVQAPQPAQARRTPKHTPGPWSAFISRRSKTVSVDIGPVPHGRRPNVVNWMGFDSCDLPLNQQIANARLIAAAPELLSALVAARAEIWRLLDAKGVEPKQAREWPEIVSAEAAIAKATGAPA